MPHRRNNFDILRLFFAFSVMVAHTSLISEIELPVFWKYLFNSNLAVKGFFVISGYLIFLSYARSGSITHYMIKRIARIYPGYILAILINLFVAFFCYPGSLVNFVKAHDLIDYLWANLVFLNFLKPSIGDIFSDHVSPVLNGSLWTLKIEVMFYTMVPLIYCFVTRITIKTAYIIFLGTSLSWMFVFFFWFTGNLSAQLAQQLPGQLIYFGVGIIIAKYQIRIDQRFIFLSLILFFVPYLFHFTYPWRDLYFMVVFPWCVMSIALCRWSIPVSKKIGDLSYGIYLFHYPIAQFYEHFDFFSEFGSLAVVICFVQVCVMAYFAWHFVEKRFIRIAAELK